MTRLVYCWLLHLHPSPFRRRFEQEMLGIFDEAVLEGRAFHLVLDAAQSLIRQRFFRPANIRCVAGATAMFAPIGGAPLHPAALLTGALVSCAMFAGVIKAATYTRPSAASQNRSFEVSSIKPNKANVITTVDRQPGGRFVATRVNLKTLIRLAYGVEDFQLAGGPGWTESDYYDVEAKGEGITAQNQFPPALQSLLRDRFALKVHREMRDMPVYALVIGNGGSKLKISRDANGNPILAVPPGPLPPPPPPPPPAAPGARVIPAPPDPSQFPPGAILSGSGFVVGRAKSLDNLATVLRTTTGRPVINRTGLTGLFDFALQWAPGPDIAADDPRPSIFTAVQEQLGLRLDSQRGPVEFVVVDAAERPAEN